MRRAWLLCVLSAASAPPASAGQLHVQYYGLREVRERDGVVLVGTIVAAEGEGRERVARIKIAQVFAGPAPREPLPAVGSEVARALYPGVEWTNPRVSPIDERLRDGLPDVPAAGARVLVVPAPGGRFELTHASPARLRALDILYAPDPRARLAGEPLAKVQADLRDLDVASLAKDELARRKALTAAVVLSADPTFVDQHFRALEPAARAAFVDEVLPATRSSPALRKVAVRVALASLRPPAIGATARLVAQLDRRDAEEARLFEETRVALMTVVEQVPDVDLSPFADHLVASTLARPAHREHDDWLPKLLARCDTAAQARMAAKLLGAVYSSSRARGDAGDAFVLHTAVELARAAPSEALWAPLTTLDPQKPRVTSQKEDVLAAMVELGVALVRHDPRARDRVRDLVEPHLDDGLHLPPELEKSYRETIGALPAGAPAPTSLSLRPGQIGRLASGERVSLRADADAVVVVFATPGAGSEERTIDPAEDGYREWWVPPYVVIVKRAGAATHLRFTPASADPAMEPADAYAVAKKICDRRGATGAVEQDSRDYDGVYLYQADGPPKPCRVRVGLRTRKVLP